MNRALTLLAASAALAFSTAASAGPSLTASIYAADVEVGAGDASPDGILLDFRAPLNRHFWLGGTLATALGDDQIAPGTPVELDTSLAFNLGVETEFAHQTFGYAYIGYGAAGVASPAGDVDGKGVSWGLGMRFGVGDRMLVDAGYASLFDGDMEDSAGTSFATTIAGPRVGIGAKF